MPELPYFKWYPIQSGIGGCQRPPFGPYAIIDARATALDEYFLSMDDASLGRLFRRIGKALMNGEPPPKLIQRTEFSLIRSFHFPGRTRTTGRNRIPKEIRLAVLSAGACLWCQSTKDLTIDHKIPYSKGGPETLDNLQCLCRSCNSKKGARHA